MQSGRIRGRFVVGSIAVGLFIGGHVLSPVLGQSAQEPASSAVPEDGPGEEPGTAAAEDEAPSLGQDAAVLSETVIVTTSRLERDLATVPANVVVLTDRLEETAALTLDDTLRQVPGFSLFRRSSSLVSHPTTQGVSLRGVGPSGVSRTLVLVDGIPLNDAFGGWVYWSRFSRLELAKAEVVPGGASNVWGNYALGGVIQLFTEPGSGARVSVLGEAGEWSTLGIEGLAGIELGGADLMVTGGHFETDGYYVLREDQRGEIDVPAWSDHDSLGLRGRAGLGPHGQIDGRYEHFEEERGNGTRLTGNDTSLDALRLGLDGMAGRSSWSLNLFGDDQEFVNLFSAQSEDRDTEVPALYQFEVPSDSFTVSGLWARELGAVDRTEGARHTLSAGGEWRILDGATNELFFWNGSDFNRQRSAGGDQELGGVWLQDEIAGRRWNLQVGARVDQWNATNGFLLEIERSDGSIRQDLQYPDRRETTFSPKVGLTYELAEAHVLYGSAYQSFRAPTVNELYRPFRVRNDITAANALLVPETLQGFEAGWRYTTVNTRVRAAAFDNRLDDAVANVTIGSGPGVVDPCGFVPGGGVCRQRANLDRVRVRGLEADVQQRIGRFELGLSYLLSDAEVREAAVSPSLEGKTLVQVPENQLSARLQHSGFLETSFQLRWVDQQFDDDLNTRVLSSFFVADLWLGHSLGSGVSLFAGVQNLFDEEIEVAVTDTGLVSTGMPRMLYGGVRWSWGGGR